MDTIHQETDCAVDTIEHQGVITKIDDKIIYVNIITQSACVSCSVKGACNVSDMKEEVIEISRKNSPEQKVGDHVTLTMKKSLGITAVMLGYIFPFLLLVITLVASLNIFSSEGVAGLLALGILVPYYLTLYFFKDRLKQTFIFKMGLNK